MLQCERTCERVEESTPSTVFDEIEEKEVEEEDIDKSLEVVVKDVA